MKYRKMLKRKIYPTWVSVTKIKGCKVYILYIPKEKIYHFQVLCDSGLEYSSLDNGIAFDNFEECCASAELWIRLYCKK